MGLTADRRMLSTGFLLGMAGGIALIAATGYFRRGPAEVFPGVVVLLLAPLVFRAGGWATSLRAITRANLVVSSVMTLLFYGYLALVYPAPVLPWTCHAWRIALGLGIAGLTAAACAWIANLYFVAGARHGRTETS